MTENLKIVETAAMLKLIPNGITVCLEDLEEIYSQDGNNKLHR